MKKSDENVYSIFTFLLYLNINTIDSGVYLYSGNAEFPQEGHKVIISLRNEIILT